MQCLTEKQPQKTVPMWGLYLSHKLVSQTGKSNTDYDPRNVHLNSFVQKNLTTPCLVPLLTEEKQSRMGVTIISLVRSSDFMTLTGSSHTRNLEEQLPWLVQNCSYKLPLERGIIQKTKENLGSVWAHSGKIHLQNTWLPRTFRSRFSVSFPDFPVLNYGFQVKTCPFFRFSRFQVITWSTTFKIIAPNKSHLALLSWQVGWRQKQFG